MKELYSSKTANAHFHSLDTPKKLKVQYWYFQMGYVCNAINIELESLRAVVLLDIFFVLLYFWTLLKFIFIMISNSDTIFLLVCITEYLTISFTNSQKNLLISMFALI